MRKGRLKLTAMVREERGSPLRYRGEILPYGAQRPMEGRVERGGEGWSYRMKVQSVTSRAETQTSWTVEACSCEVTVSVRWLRGGAGFG